MTFDAPWWPPKVGDRLRSFHGPDDDPEDTLLHVVAVFDHDNWTLAVTAEWFKHKRRWNYEVRDITEAHYGLIRPDGAPRKTRKETP